MSGGANLLIAASLGYAGLLFAIAAFAEARARAGRAGWLRSPLVYTLSLSVYCTAWTFYGAVGYAARSGIEFATIYLGPTLVMIGWWALLRRIVRVGRAQRVTSIADLVSSRYGKSPLLGVMVTALAVLGTTPYVALQLQSITVSAAAFAGWDPGGAGGAALVAGGLAAFAILFGTRSLDMGERHHGVVAAVALEAVVKLVALLAVGAFVVWGLGGGAAETLARVGASSVGQMAVQPARWTAILFLSGAAFLCLPRMFQVAVVETPSERALGAASWAFPLYLLAMSLFVMPIAAIGLERLPAGADPDLFVLLLPLAEEREGLAMLAFLGGFSSATSMVVVASIALATMVSNQIVVPLWLARRRGGASVAGDVRSVTITARRLTIAGVAALGWLYLRVSGGGGGLAAIGLVSFAGVAQILPAMVGGLLWRGATRWGAAAGLGIGFALWAWMLVGPALLPGRSFGAGIMPLVGGDPLVSAIAWSIGANLAAFVLVSLLTFPTPAERLQGAQFVLSIEGGRAAGAATIGDAGAEDLLVMAQRLLGGAQTQALFAAEAARQGAPGTLPRITPAFVDRLERQLAGTVGAATAQAMVEQVGGGGAVTARQLMAVADESAELREYSARLEAQQAALRLAAGRLREANEKLRRLAVQKDAFLGQVSHELRTPMTSIRAFSEILRTGADLAPAERERYAGVIHDEGVRLTRLLDDLLEMSVLESGAQVALRLEDVSLGEVIDRALRAAPTGALRVVREGPADVPLMTDAGRLEQVFINLIANAAKYCEAPAPVLTISVRREGARVQVDFADNGAGIAGADRAVIFEKFSRLSDSAAAGGAGLGLAICREIAARLGGSVDYLPGRGGAAFRVTMPLPAPAARAAE